MIQPVKLLGVDYYHLSGPDLIEGCYSVSQLLDRASNGINRYSLINRLSNLVMGKGKLITVYEAITVPIGATVVVHDPAALAAVLAEERKFINIMMLWNVCKLKPLIMQSKPLC